MTIRKKSKEELQEQAKGFLNCAEKNGKISKKTKDEISKILGLNESEKKGLIERLSKKLGKELNISDEKEIEKVLNKKHIDFDKIWKEYTDYSHKKSVDKHNDEIKQKVEAFFEPYKTPFPDANVIIINEIVENYSKNTIEKAKIFFASNFYKIACKGAIKNETFFKNFMKSVDNCDDLKFLLDRFSYDDLFEARMSKKLQNFNINAIKNSILILNKYGFDYQEVGIEDLDCMDIRTFENNVLLLINNGYDYKKISLSISDLESIDIAQYIKVLEYCNIVGFWETFDINDEGNEDIRNILLELKDFTKEQLLQLCLECGIVSINGVLSHTPNIHYEQNGGYTTKAVHISDKDFLWMIKTIRVAGGEENFSSIFTNKISEKDKILLYLRTMYWTNNWKKNIDFAFERGLINGKDILPAYEDLDLNENIAHLKLIKNSMLVDLVNKGTNQEEFISFIGDCSNIYRSNLEFLLEKFPSINNEDITISTLILLKDILSSNYVEENLSILLEKFPSINNEDITISTLILLKDILSSNYVEKNLSILLEKFPSIKTEGITIDRLIRLSDILSSEFTEGNIKVLSENCLGKNNSIEEIFLLSGIISNVQYDKILELVFEKYSGITIKQLSSLEKILVGMRMSNRIIVHNKYQDLEIKNLKELGDILSENTNPESLLIIFKKYPNISISELIPFKNIVRNNSKGSLQQIDNFGDSIPGTKSMNILSLFNDDTNTHNEIFESIENKDKINDDNWIDITGLYSAIEYFEDDKTIPEEIKVKIRELLQSDESKDFIYKKLTGLLKKNLYDNYKLTNEEIALLAVLNKKGLWNMGQSEGLAKFIYQINKLDKNYKFNKAFTEIKGEIKNFINSHKKDSNELINSFYQISTSLLERSPAIYHNVVKLLNKLNSEEQEIFYKEIFPLYNVELFLGENPGQYKLLGKHVNNNVEGQLIPMHERIKMLLNKLESNKQIDRNNLLVEEKNQLVENIKQLFKEKFGIKKIPAELSKENIESIRWHSIYLSNMHNLDEEKSAVLGYFLALKLDGKRGEFRTGKDFDPSEYMDDSKVSILIEYLSKRSERNSLCKLENIEEGDKLILQENESNTIIGNTNGITDRLKTIEGNIKTLLDDDIYSERQKIIKKYVDKDLGKLLAKQFQLLSGKHIVIDDEENKILSDLSNKLGEDFTDIKNVQKLQNECKPISAIVNFVNKTLNENLPKEIQDFENLCNPSNEHLELLKKIGIILEDDLIVSSNSYLTYVESGIRKGIYKLTHEEYDSLNEYIIRVHKELNDLYGIKDKLTTLYEDFKNKIIDKYFDNTELKQRFESMSPYFFTKADVEKENIVSLMTNDLDIIIKNIRQCLGCKDKGCNNDTDLSFGCDDRFFITTSHREGDTSFADELVTLLPRSPKEEGFTFVMDRIYGNNGSTDILLNNIYVILKKMNKLSPDLRKQLSIFIPNNIDLTLNEEGISKLKKQFPQIDIDNQEITVTVEEQPITDSYHEFGGIGCRSTGDATISGYLIKVK